MTEKTGRPRRYSLTPAGGMKHPDIARLAAAMDEVRERTADQFDDLSPEILNADPGGTGISIGRLALHLGWAEANMIRKIAGDGTGEPLLHLLTPGALQHFSDAVPSVPDSAHLLELYRRLRREVTLPVLSAVADPDAPFDHPGLRTVREVLHHLLWHWTYHGGQIGLLALQLGRDYRWMFEERG